MMIVQQGENNSRAIRIDISRQLGVIAGAEYTAELAIQRSGDAEPYMRTVPIVDGYMIYKPTQYDTERVGAISLQPVFTYNSKTLKGVVTQIKVACSLV